MIGDIYLATSGDLNLAVDTLDTSPGWHQAGVCTHTGGLCGSYLHGWWVLGALSVRRLPRPTTGLADGHGLRIAGNGPPGGAGARGCRPFCRLGLPLVVRLPGTDLDETWSSRW
jgi:hypothetical protein